MLYGTLDEKQWFKLPMCWDKTQSMFDHLQRMGWNHQLTFEARLFNTEGALYRCVLIKWEGNGFTRDKRREVLLETTDPAQMEAALLMLISEAETEFNAAKGRLSWLP
jgi:hypothetical protein